MPENDNPNFVIDAFVIRVGILALAAFLLFSVLVIRLWSMQVTGSSEYEYKDRKQSARRIDNAWRLPFDAARAASASPPCAARFSGATAPRSCGTGRRSMYCSTPVK